jgi:hypothetical protein
VVVGFGAVAVSGAYGAIGRRTATHEARPGSVDELRRFFASKSYVEHMLLAGPVLGLAAMAVRPGGPEFGQLWAVAGVVIWVVASALLLAVIRPAEAAIRAALVSVPSEDVPGPARRLMWASAATDLLFTVALLLMVTQPA